MSTALPPASPPGALHRHPPCEGGELASLCCCCCHRNSAATPTPLPRPGRRLRGKGRTRPAEIGAAFPRARRRAVEKQAIGLSPALIHGLKFTHTDVFPVKRLPRRSLLILKPIPRAICLHTKYFPSVVPASVHGNRQTNFPQNCLHLDREVLYVQS